MYSKCVLFFSALLCFCNIHTVAQFKKIDTTLTINNAGYKVSCNNKNADDNSVSVSPVGFKNTATTAAFTIKGTLVKAEIGDLNSDGYPDLVMYVFGVPNSETGTVIGISSVANNSLAPIYFPDIYADPKLRDGYRGQDEFSIRYGMLSRTFPIYKPGDADNKPTGGKRVIQYQVTTEKERSSFKVLRSYEVPQ